MAVARALWEGVDPPSRTCSPSSSCTPFTLPANGVLQLDATSFMTLTSDVVFTPLCTEISTTNDQGNFITLGDASLRDPFYASTIPQCYALSATTVISYLLLIMLMVTPRTFVTGGSIVLGRRGFTNRPAGEGIGVGGRPWLQKVAAMTVAVSLTIATVDTFKVATRQYEMGYMNAQALQYEVLSGTELKIMRTISDTFLWLAQAQTLIRLFPRQREKIIIKWTAFALVVLNLIFGILNNYFYPQYTRPRTFTDAVPALSYLFQLALGLLYCAWVIYYSIMKKKYAFYHPHMWNICLVALLSIFALMVPVVFFILDMANPDIAGWGDYVRWVGAAAASVVVWEWVERIEALERNDKKDGVLGREIFDGDEMLEVTPSTSNLGRTRRTRDSGDGGISSGTIHSPWPTMAGIANRYRPRMSHIQGIRSHNEPSRAPHVTRSELPFWPARPAPTATPVSRTDTASAESTVYAVRYHPIGSSLQVRTEPTVRTTSSSGVAADVEDPHGFGTDESIDIEKHSRTEVQPVENLRTNTLARAWQVFDGLNPFYRKRHEPPAEVSAHIAPVEKKNNPHNIATSRWDLRGRLEDFASIQADRLKERINTTHDSSTLTVNRIPAPQRSRTFQQMSELIEEGEDASGSEISARRDVEERRPQISRGASDSSIPRNNMHLTSTPNPEEIIYRGALSFAPPQPRPRDNHTIAITAPTATTIQTSSRSGSAPQSPRQSLSGTQTSTSNGLPIMRIPAPPRPGRTPP